jgi:oxygen-dependent protoporphyrinogen oxidase
MIAALERALPAGSIRLNAPAARILPAAGGVRIELASGERLEAAAAVVSTPAYVTAALLREADARLSSLCADIEYASTATVALAFTRSAVGHPLNGSGFVVPRVESNGLLAASWLSSKWAHRAPAGHVLMRGFAGGARDPRALDRSDAELVAMTLGSLRPLLGISGEPIFTRVYRWERKNAQHNVGHLARIEQIDRMLAAHPRLFITGSGFRGVGIPDCVADARATARKVVECVRLVASPVRS